MTHNQWYKKMSIHTSFAGSTLLSKGGGGWEPQRKSNFAAIIYGVGGVSLALQLKDADLPPASYTRKGIKYFNQTSHYAGEYTPPDEWNLNYHDYIDRNGWEALSGWLNQVGTNGAINNAGSYKKCGEIIMMGPDGSTVRKYMLDGIFPTSLKGEGFDHTTDGDPHVINLTMSVDYVRTPGRA